MRSMTRVWSIATAAATAVLAVPALAAGAVSIDTMTAAPAGTQAGAHSDFSLALGLSGTDHAKSLVIHLPGGLVGNTTAATPCSEETFAARGCATSGPASSKVGVSSISAVATAMGIPTNITASGSVFVLQPRPGELARLGIDLYPDGAAALLSPHAILNQSVVSVRKDGDHGLDSTLTDLPRTSQTSTGEADVHLTGLNLTLSAQGGKGPFMSNPTSCGPATTTVDIVSYESPASVSKSASFTPTGCDKLPFAPEVSLSASGDLAKRGRPALKVAVTQAAGQASAKTVTVKLPAAVTSELLHTDRKSCSIEAHAAGTCPAASKIGTATAETAILAQPLTGDVTLLATTSGLPGLSITLQPLGITVIGQITLDQGRVVNTFDNLPDTPLSNFELNLNGGKAGILANTVDLCGGAPALADGTFLGHNGGTATASSALKPVGCKGGGTPPRAGKPTLTASLRKLGTKRAALTLKAKAGKSAPKLRRVRVTLPTGVSLRSLRKKVLAVSPKGLKAKKVGGRVVELRTTAKAGVASMTVTLKAGALKTSGKSRRKLKVVVYDVAGTATTISRTAAK